MENYQIIMDQKLLEDFVEWLPELTDDECYYICLFARSKYVRDLKDKYIPHISSDKAQLKRIIVNKKELIISKIKQMECKIGSYTTKYNLPIPQEALALYITVNPRSQSIANFILMKKLLDIQQTQARGYNIHAEAMSAIQKAKSRTCYIDFDIDENNSQKLEIIITQIHTHINIEAITLLRTRGGIHCLIDPTKVINKYRKSFYQNINKIPEVDLSGDQMIPIPGTYQGGFIPNFIK